MRSNKKQDIVTIPWTCGKTSLGTTYSRKSAWENSRQGTRSRTSIQIMINIVYYTRKMHAFLGPAIYFDPLGPGLEERDEYKYGRRWWSGKLQGKYIFTKFWRDANLLQVSVNVWPGELLHLLLPDLVDDLWQKLYSFVHLSSVDWAYAHDCLHFPHWIIDMLFRSLIILDHPASLSDWDISVLLPVHLIAQGPVQLIEAPGIEADRGNCIKTTFKKKLPFHHNF